MSSRYADFAIENSRLFLDIRGCFPSRSNFCVGCGEVAELFPGSPWLAAEHCHSLTILVGDVTENFVILAAYLSR